ncbi:hypothetical protein QFZ32_005604 [Streptomyces canus]|nr:hypothetical protein [Streptomyces canus]
MASRIRGAGVFAGSAVFSPVFSPVASGTSGSSASVPSWCSVSVSVPVPVPGAGSVTASRTHRAGAFAGSAVFLPVASGTSGSSASVSSSDAPLSSPSPEYIL